MSSLIKNILVIAVLGSVAYAGYYVFVIQNESSLNTGSRANEGELLTTEFLQKLGDLQRIDLSGEFFRDARLRSLTDFSTVPEAVSGGRSNPFSSAR